MSDNFIFIKFQQIMIDFITHQHPSTPVLLLELNVKSSVQYDLLQF